MFSEAEKSAYRAVSAPETLRSRVLDMAADVPQRKTRPRRRWMTTAVAACFALVMLSSVLLPGSSTEILVEGAAVGGEPIAVGRTDGVALARAAEQLRVPLAVKTREEMTLIPEHGVLRSGDTMIAARCEIDSPAELIWEIESPDPAKTYVLRIDCGEERSVLTLAFDAAENCWTVFSAQE